MKTKKKPENMAFYVLVICALCMLILSAAALGRTKARNQAKENRQKASKHDANRDSVFKKLVPKGLKTEE
ncbi:MAG: hypothetical protein J6Y08_10205 [Clostridiales bacterium]|nr:hypothetical protein [Clostridiales bacterium]